MREYPALHSGVHSRANNTDGYVSPAPAVPWKAGPVMREPEDHSTRNQQPTMADITPTQVASMAFDSAYLSSRLLPTAPDGYYDWQISSDPAAKREGHARVTNLINKAAFTDAVTHPTLVDDRKGAFAAGLGMLARMDRDDDVTKKMNNSVIGTLYNTVPHPPVSYLGPFSTYREADGGGNSAQNTNIGRGGTPYSRSVQGKAGLPRHSLPDPSLVFDTILKRRDHQIHAGGMSNMIFAFASIVTHSLFRTDPQDMNINLASSYLDLSPLYGDNQAAQDKVRDKAAGRGFLFPDTFSEERLLFAPPATSALLVIFSRNHHYIARRLLQINEFKKLSDPPPSDAVAHAIQDEEIFQTARLVNCGHFMSAIMGNYVAGFLGSSEGCNWNMDALDVIDTKSLKVKRGQGNHCSVEFNILYRWHATISEQDQKWSENVFRAAFGGKSFDEITASDVTSMTSLFTEISSTPSQRVFAGYVPRFLYDDDLADVLQCATENPAGAFRGRGTPEVLRIAEVEGIRQARQWGLCTMNEFRVFLGLKPFETFEEWYPDPAIVVRLFPHVTKNIDQLYLLGSRRRSMPLTDGSRFACGYTVRGDCFYTSDFTPANLTAWGFQDCQRDMNNGDFGGQIPKFLVCHLPLHYSYNSVYSCFPFFTLSKMKASLAAQKLEARYTFDRPAAVPEAKILNTFTGIKHVFNDPSRFNFIYEKYGYGSFMNTDEVVKHDTDKAMTMHAVLYVVSIPCHSSDADYQVGLGAVFTSTPDAQSKCNKSFGATVSLFSPPALAGVCRHSQPLCWSPSPSRHRPPCEVRTEDEIIAIIERKRRRNLARKCRHLEGKRARDHHHQEDAKLKGAPFATNPSDEEHVDTNRAPFAGQSAGRSLNAARHVLGVPSDVIREYEIVNMVAPEPRPFIDFQRPWSAVGPWVAAVHRPDALEVLRKGRIGHGVGGSSLSTHGRYE
ncbi:hypothetical protein D9615_010185 [Tricholomella constricta]|uniref:Heme peroxidase n=1 Tax=Tricholomella constricta TaxID=117010 RepID=A0A8H5LS92_9AGAR|nr:hypothetical protein D9615_010185 [Tricholomella constricta]